LLSRQVIMLNQNIGNCGDRSYDRHPLCTFGILHCQA
jgi:hypothetical protein